MFLVGGGILTHGLPPLRHAVEALTQRAAGVGSISGVLGAIVPLLLDAATGIVAGALVLLAVTSLKRFKPAPKAAH